MAFKIEYLKEHEIEDIVNMLSSSETELFERIDIRGKSEIAIAYRVMPRHAFKSWLHGFLKGSLTKLYPLDIKRGKE